VDAQEFLGEPDPDLREGPRRAQFETLAPGLEPVPEGTPARGTDAQAATHLGVVETVPDLDRDEAFEHAKTLTRRYRRVNG